MNNSDLSAMVAFWQERMGLLHWDIESKFVKETHGGPGSSASIWLPTDYETAKLEVKKEHKNDPSHVSYLVLHELAHVLLRDMDQLVSGASEALAPSTQEFFDERYKHEQEKLVDRIARIIHTETKE